jgi:hypothetical protein
VENRRDQVAHASFFGPFLSHHARTDQRNLSFGVRDITLLIAPRDRQMVILSIDRRRKRRMTARTSCESRGMLLGADPRSDSEHPAGEAGTSPPEVAFDASFARAVRGKSFPGKRSRVLACRRALRDFTRRPIRWRRGKGRGGENARAPLIRCGAPVAAECDGTSAAAGRTACVPKAGLHRRALLHPRLGCGLGVRLLATALRRVSLRLGNHGCRMVRLVTTRSPTTR